jgi:xanthine/uracil permease
MTYSVHPVDERLPIARLAPPAIQHVLVMYAGAVAVPLIIGRAVNLPPEQVVRCSPWQPRRGSVCLVSTAR